MARTLAQITKQIDKLQKEADALRQAELKGVVDRIKVAISHYGLTPDQLGFGKPAVTVAKLAKPTTKSSGKATAPRFSDGDGQVWSGRGPRPRWLREELAHGRSLEEFSTEARKQASKPGTKATQSNVVAVGAPSAKANERSNRAKVGSKKTATVAAPSSGAVVLAQANAADSAAPKAKRQLKTAPPKSAPAKKGRPTKAASTAAKGASQPKAKRLKPVATDAKKAVAAPNAEGSDAAVTAAAGG